jgi:hypothetical protein
MSTAKRKMTANALDSTANRIRAYLASMQPLCGSDVSDDDIYHRGRSLIERMALKSSGIENPDIRLTARQCRDVLHFVACSEPIEPRTWWDDPKDAPSHAVGFTFVLWVIHDHLTKTDNSAAERSSTEFPCDLDAACIALEQAKGILDLLTAVSDEVTIPDTLDGTLSQTLHAAIGEIDRAQLALFGPEKEAQS